ncbi:hypothetical protein COT47_01400 [Candidatus Woesearchaeota archaeon CG08_land_8_20_14_0_20_43_7]|nr:MAG: hypothetical protein COT47_01400 [Candidatus Woesearchaeota archaeon CG08_land_8_20_14_0_20_43_7]
MLPVETEHGVEEMEKKAKIENKKKHVSKNIAKTDAKFMKNLEKNFADFDEDDNMEPLDDDYDRTY